MAWYKTGTINFTNGGATVYGNGTLWVDAAILNSGDLLIAPDGKLYEIGSFQSNTQLTLTTGYLGAAANNQAYAIVPIGLLPSALAQQVKTTLSTANTALSQAVRFDAVQNLPAPQQATARSNIGALAGADVGLGLLSKSVAGNVGVTLSGAEAAALFYEFTGALTGNISVIVPTSVRQFYVRNATSGAYTLTLKTAAGAGVIVAQGTREILECDGTNVLRPTSIASALTVDASGNIFAGGNLCVGASASAAGERLYISSPNGTRAVVRVGQAALRDWYMGMPNGGSANFAITDASAGIDRITVDTNGNLLVGRAASYSGYRCAVDTTATAQLAVLINGLEVFVIAARAAPAGSPNGASTIAYVQKDSGTSRSINAAGTINATGADYAEYMTKSDGCGVIAKGDIVGVDATGQLTDNFSAAISYLIKSTNPSYVGGDTWGSEDALQIKRPVEPVFEAPVYTGSEKPADLQEGEASWGERDTALAQYEADQAAYAITLQAARGQFDKVIVPTYRQALEKFETALETARQKVDRIAYCGQVPVNVTGAKPGEFILPDNGGASWDLMNDPEVPGWFKKYVRAVGIVQNILPDGRANVRVKVA